MDKWLLLLVIPIRKVRNIFIIIFLLVGSAKAQEVKLVLPIGHTAVISAVQFSPDGKKILTASNDHTAKVWEAQSGTLLLDLKGHVGWVSSAHFSPDGKRIVTASVDHTAKVWDAQKGTILLDLRGHSYWVRYAEFSPDGTKIVTASWDNTAKVWDAQSGTLLLNLTGHTSFVNSAQFSPDGKKILTASNDKTVKIWDVENGNLMLDLKGHAEGISSAQFSMDGKKILTFSWDHTAKIWNAESGSLLLDLKGHTNDVISAQFSPDGKKIVTASLDKTAKVWDAENGNLMHNLQGHTDGVNFARFSPDCKKIVTTSLDYIAKVWDAQIGTPLVDLKGHSEGVVSARFSPDGKKILTASDNNNTANVWDAQNGTLLLELRGHAKKVNYAGFSPDGKRIVTASWDHTAKIWDAQNGTLLLDLKGHSDWVRHADFSPDGKKIVTASWDHTAKVWDAQSGSLLLDLKGHELSIISAEFSLDGKKILTASDDKTTKVWDAKNGALLLDFIGHPWGLSDAHFSPDGKRILTSSDDDSTAKVWDAQSGTLLLDLKGHTGGINCAQFSPDGKKIITASGDNTAKVWNAQYGNLLLDLKGHVLRVISAQFSPDGKRILTASNDRTAKVWNTENGNELYTFFAVDSSDFLTVDKDYRYDGSVRARKLLYFTCGSEVVSLEQMKESLWVPDLVQRINRGEVINNPKLTELNLCGLIPIVTEKEQEDTTFYSFTIIPQRGGLGITDLLVNGIPTLKYTPQQLKKTNEGYLLIVTKTELLPYLITGQPNPIKVIAHTSDNAISSRGVSINLPSDNKQVIPNLYAVIVGISTYKEEEMKLHYAAKDAQDIGNAISLASKKLLNQDGKEHVFIYNFNTNNDRYGYPEKINIQHIFDTIAAKAQKTDILLVFFAGHGVVEENAAGQSGNKKQFYFLTSDASSFNNVANTGISTQELIAWMHPSKMKAQKRILILDACNSGEAINDISKNTELMAVRNTEQAEGKREIERLNDEAGMFILSASASKQSAYEMDRYSQGLLTYTLLKAIKQQPDILDNDKYLDLSRWFNAAKKSVTDIMYEMGTRGRQEPQVIANTNYSIGIVDHDVRDHILLADEKPIFTRSDFRNVDSHNDNLKLRSIVDKQLSDESSRGSDNKILYEGGYEGSEGYTLSGDYKITGNDIVMTVYLNKGGTTTINKVPWQFKSTVNTLEVLANEIAQKAIEAVNKK